MTRTVARVLHVLGGTGRGGSETWLLQVLQCMDPNRVRTDVLVNVPGGPYEERIRELGAGVLSCGNPRHPLRYSTGLFRLLRNAGPYHAVHSHLQLFSGLIMRVARFAGVRGRIAHSRNVRDAHARTPYRVVYQALMRRWLHRHATHLLAVSSSAAEGAFGAGVLETGRCQLMTGIDLTPFRRSSDREVVRTMLGISPGTPVVGHVGSFRRQKNHEFLIELALQLLAERPDTLFLLIGDGALRPGFQEAVVAAGISHAFQLLGERDDVPSLYSAMDVMVLPSLYEGLPRVLLESQAAGVSCVASTNITPEAAVGPDMLQFLDLQSGPKAWADVIGNCLSVQGSRGLNGPSAEERSKTFRYFEERGLTTEANAQTLTELYEGFASRGHQ